MLERKRADITIYSPVGAEIATVPITEECKRVKKLMEEDSITLSFTLDEALHVPIGSYIDDEIFGRYFITEEQLASFSERVGGYEHTLQFNAWHYQWSLKQHMLTTTASSKRVRKETQWTLTANLETHLREVYHNLLALDFVEKPTVVRYTGDYTNIFCPYLAEEGGKYSIRIYSKYAVDYDTFFEVDYTRIINPDTEDEDTEDYQVCVYIPKGERISSRFDGDVFDYLTPASDVSIYGVYLAKAVNTEKKTADIIKGDGTVVYYDTWDFYGVRMRGSTYDGCIYTWIDKEAYTSKEAMKRVMGMYKTSVTTWRFPDEEGYDETDAEKADLAKKNERAEYDEDFTAEEDSFTDCFDISEDIENRLNALTISFSGTDIISALKSIADTFECEYWVETDTPTTSTPYPAFTVHFGKCEYGDTQTISCEDYTEDGEDRPLNTESMSLNKDTAESADKLYVYGSEDNIPYSYRKKLIARCVKIFEDYRMGDKIRCAYFQVEHILKGYRGFIDGNWLEHTAALPTLDIYVPAQKKTLRSWKSGDNVKFEATVGDRIYIPQGVYTVQGIPARGTVLDLLHDVKVGTLVDSDEHEYISDEDADNFSGTCCFGFINENGSEYEPLVANSQGGYYSRGDRYSAATAGMWYGYENFSRWCHTYIKSSTVILEGGYYRLGTWGELSDDFYTIRPSKYSDIEIMEGGLSLTFKGTDTGRTETGVECKGKEYTIVQNPLTMMKPMAVTDTDKEAMKYYCSKIPDGMDIAVGDRVTFLDADGIDIPQHYFTTPYDDATSLYQIGARRLMLPENGNPDDSLYWDNADNPQWVCVNGAIVPYAYRGDMDDKSLVESTIAFDKVYPDGKMKVSRVIPEDKDYIEEATGDVEKYTWKWRQYHLHLVTADGEAMDFKEDYILDGYTLGIRFLPPTDLTNEQLEAEPKTDLKSGCKLAGMQFEDNFEDSRAPYVPSGYNNTGTSRDPIPTSDGEYDEADLLQDHIIVRNDDFGAKLPNDVLYPQEGDPCCLINWDVRAVKRLGLIASAERRLMQKAFEYAQALKEGNFTFTCNMMSGFFFDLAGEYVKALSSVYGYEKLFDREKTALYDYDEKRLYAKRSTAAELLQMLDTREGDTHRKLFVKNDYDVYAIPDIGQRVKVMHQGLAQGYKETRIIGYELKLDKPYDTPRLTCGETEAYSRVRQLEKEITKLNNK